MSMLFVFLFQNHEIFAAKAHNAIHLAAHRVQLFSNGVGNGTAHADGEAMSQRTAVEFDARHLDGGVSCQHREVVAIGIYQFLGNEALGLEHTVEGFHTVALAHDEPVSAVHLGVGCIHVHHPHIERS